MGLVFGSVGKDGGHAGWDVHRDGGAGWVAPDVHGLALVF